jgi:hypothetical protein
MEPMEVLATSLNDDEEGTLKVTPALVEVRLHEPAVTTP